MNSSFWIISEKKFSRIVECEFFTDPDAHTVCVCCDWEGRHGFIDNRNFLSHRCRGKSRPQNAAVFGKEIRVDVQRVSYSVFINEQARSVYRNKIEWKLEWTCLFAKRRNDWNTSIWFSNQRRKLPTSLSSGMLETRNNVFFIWKDPHLQTKLWAYENKTIKLAITNSLVIIIAVHFRHFDGTACIKIRERFIKMIIIKILIYKARKAAWNNSI